MQFDLKDFEWLLDDEVIGYVTDFAQRFAAIILILFLGYIVAGYFQRLIVRRAERSKRIDPTISGFVSLIVRYAILSVAFVAVLSQMGIATTSIVALLGAAGLAVALALQGTLSNIAAGFMLVSFRPFRVGHFVDAGGEAGTVKEIGLFATEIVTVDNVKIVIPNNQLWGGSIKNFSAFPKRRLDLTFGVSYGSDLKTAEGVLREAIATEQARDVPRIVNDPALPFVAVTNLGDSSVDFQMRVWCRTEDYWALRFDMLRDVKERLDAAGVDIPFPSRTIYTQAAGPSDPTPPQAGFGAVVDVKD